MEVVSGKAFEDFLQERLFTPLDMKDTTFWPDAAQLARLAKSYGPNAEKADLVEIPLGQLKTPLDRHEGRFPMPAAGQFLWRTMWRSSAACC